MNLEYPDQVLNVELVHLNGIFYASILSEVGVIKISLKNMYNILQELEKEAKKGNYKKGAK